MIHGAISALLILIGLEIGYWLALDDHRAYVWMALGAMLFVAQGFYIFRAATEEGE